MPFRAQLILSTLGTIVQSLPGIQQVYIGVPATLTTRVSAYITCGAGTPSRKTTQNAYRRMHFMVTFAYRTAGDDTGAEMTIAGLIDAFTLAVYADPMLQNSQNNAELDMSGADMPQYMAVAGQEFRRYPIVVITEEQQQVT